MARSKTQLATLLIILLISFSAAAAERQPGVNIVMIVADDLGYGDLGCYGSKTIRTPTLDALANGGVRCSDFYVASPICSPSRASLLTGRYPLRHQMTDVLVRDENLKMGLKKSEVLLPQLLKSKGYVCGAFGKWHIGSNVGFRPFERGFDEFLGHLNGGIDYFKHTNFDGHDLYRNAQPIEVDGYSTDIFANEAMKFVEQHCRQTFFLYLAFNAPHVVVLPKGGDGPAQAPDKYMQEYSSEKNPWRHGYMAAVTAMDDAIGRVLDKLKSLNLERNTIVIFLSDNGGSIHGGASNTPLHGEKATVWEGGIRVPCILSWPGKFESGRVCHESLIEMDLFSLALAVANATPPPNTPLDGRNPLPIFLNTQQPESQRGLFFSFRQQWAVRDGAYKAFCSQSNSKPELFDISSDLRESHDLSAEHPEILRALVKQYKEWRFTSSKN